MTTRIAAALGAGALAVGILAGSAGTIVLREAITPQAGPSSAQMTQLGSMMSGASGMMSGASGMMSGASGMMSGAGGMMSGQNGTGPASSAMPDWMQGHHPVATAVPAQ